MPRVVRSAEAKRDVAEIWRYIASRNMEAGERWLSHLDDKLRFLAEFPGMGPTREELATSLRSFPVGNYVIFYEPIKGGIKLVRVLHGARDIDRIFREAN